MLSSDERVTLLREVPFFHGVSIDRLQTLAASCEEQLFPKDALVYNQGDIGGSLYIVISGRIAIEQTKPTGGIVRLATIEAPSYFGEESLFDESPRISSAMALVDTVVLCLQREPLITLTHQDPDLSLELLGVLCQRLREANTRIAELTRPRPRQLQQLFDQYE